MTFQLTADQKVNLTVAFVDKHNNAVIPTLDAIPTWASDDNGAFVTLAAAADGMSVDVTTVGPIGAANITFNAMIGGTAFTATLAVTVVAGAAATVSIVTGTPASK